MEEQSASYQRPFKSRVTSKEAWSFLFAIINLSGSPGTLVTGVDAGNGRYREPTRQGLRPAEILQALTQLLTHAQHTKLHRMLTTRVCNTVYHQCSLYQTLFTAQRVYYSNVPERERKRCTRHRTIGDSMRERCSVAKNKAKCVYICI